MTDDNYRIYQLPYETEGVLMIRLIYENSKLTSYTNNEQVFLYNPVYDRLIDSVTILLDGSEQPINRPKYDQKEYYSGKKSNILLRTI